jgi:hypothetical protein
MVFSVSPSVTIREVDLTSSIPAIATPPAAIAGAFRWGPTDERVLISSENELVSVFGEPRDFNAETFFVTADFLSYSNAIYVTRVVSGANSATATSSSNTVIFEGKYPGSYVNDVEVSYVVTGSNGNTEPYELELFADTATDSTNIKIEFNTNVLYIANTSPIDVQEIELGDAITLGSDEAGFQSLTVTGISSVGGSIGGFIYAHAITFRQRFTLALDTSVYSNGISRVVRNWGGFGLVENAPEPNGIHIIVTDKTGSISGTPNSVLERFTNLSITSGAKTPEGNNLYYKDVLDLRSRYINGNIAIADASIREYIDLTGGTDGANEGSIPLGVIAKGYDLYKEANDVDVSFILQGKGEQNAFLANYLIANIAEARKDCMVFVSPNKQAVEFGTDQQKLNAIIAYRNKLQNSSYWVMDSGYKYRYDKYNDVFRWIPLNGDIAGISSLVDPWESPAGLRKGRIRNVIKLAFNPNKTQRDQLYGRDVNPVISQAGQGTVLFGDKTGLGTASGSAFTRINVRRLFITVQKAIATISAQFLFEFNDEFTQNQFRQIVEPFLRDIQGRRGIIDYRVISDATVNTPQVIDSNVFRANIFIKPARAINFIELTFIATRTGVEFEEIIGQQF